MLEQLTSKEAMDFIAKVQEPFKSLPHLPKGVVEFFVKLAPWFALLGAILGLIGGPLIGFFGALGSILGLNPTILIATVVSVVLTIANSVILFMAFTPLKNRELKGWVFIFWSEVIGIVENIVNVFLSGGAGAVGAILGILIGLYFLFEMRPFYTGKE